MQSERNALKMQFSVMKETVAKKREQLQKEFATHTQIKKDIEVWQREVVNLLVQNPKILYVFYHKRVQNTEIFTFANLELVNLYHFCTENYDQSRQYSISNYRYCQ